MTELCYPAGTDWACYGTQEQIDALDPAVKERSEALAWMQLAALTADQVGVCPITVRPCNQACLGGSHIYLAAPVGAAGRYAGAAPGGFSPHIGSGGRWINACGCGLGDCSCTALCEAILPGPVGGIVEVTLDGATVDATAYRVDGGTRLVRTDGLCWPACQDMTADITEPGSFAVTYYQGAAPDPLSLYIAGLLAAEYYKACTADKTCRLPQKLQSVARQGVTYQIAFDDDGTTGIREVDDYVARLNPHHLKMPSVITSPDARRARQTTWSR
jgi:hypothetical protein